MACSTDPPLLSSAPHGDAPPVLDEAPVLEGAALLPEAEQPRMPPSTVGRQGPALTGTIPSAPISSRDVALLVPASAGSSQSSPTGTLPAQTGIEPATPPASGASTVLPNDGEGDSAPVSTSPAATSVTADPVRTFTAPAPLEPELKARTWKLSTAQYEASVVALLGVSPDVSGFTPDLDNGVFANFSSTGLVRIDEANAYLRVAQQVADGVGDDVLIDLGGGCVLDVLCRDTFIRTLLFRAFRRPVTDLEVLTYAELFDAAARTGDDKLAYRTVVKAVLTSPHFLYRTELGAVEDEGKEEFTLTNDEVATLLAFSVTGQPPSELFRSQAEGKLLSTDGIFDVVSELLASPAAERQFQNFLAQWLQVDKFSSLTKFEDVYPGFTAAQPLIWDETANYLHAHGSFAATLQQLFATPLSAADLAPELLDFYTSDPSATELGPRFGILSLGSVLATHANANLTSPTARGVFVRKRILCENLTPPPLGIPALSDTEAKGSAKTTRELFEQHVSKPVCASCHQLTDPIGFVFENFDGAGRYRTLDTTQGASEPVDPSGKLVYTDVNAVLTGPEDLAKALAQSEFTRECLSLQAFRYYFGQAEAGRGLPPIVAGHSALTDSGVLGELVAALMATESTFKRRRD